MIRLVHPDISQIIEFKENIINVLVIENPIFFRDFISDINYQINNLSGKIILSNDYKVLNISKFIEIIVQFYPFEMNKKSIINKLNNNIEKICIDDYNLECKELFSKIENLLNQLIVNYDYPIKYDLFEIDKLIKLANFSFDNEYDSLIEKLIDYMEIIRGLECDKVFIFVNIKSYLTSDEIIMFYEMINAKKLNVLILESYDSLRLKYENKIIIDESLCEI